VPADPTDRARPDACPGAIAVHAAADGGLARVRVPGGTLTNAQFTAIFTASADLGDGGLELTSRANIQIRGLADGAQVELADRLWQAGLLPSLSHERVRNIIASPLGDTQHLVDALDQALCAEPGLAGLPGRLLITVDDGRGDVSGLGGDIGLHGDALLLAGQDTGLRVSDPISDVVLAAREFLAIRGDAWRVAEVPAGARRITAKLGVPGPDRLDITVPLSLTPGPVGDVTVVGVPLGRLSQAQARALCAAGPWVRLTPWRSVIVPGVPDLAGTGLVTDPASPWNGVTACTGRPGCSKSLADVRADAADWVQTRTTTVAVHWAGCERRCGRPAGPVVDMIATDDGYRISEE
jgi:precorrin-3B synthase